MKKPFHLAWFLSQGWGPKSWRGDWPGSDVERWMMPDLFVDLARGMERACFDYIMCEDTLMVSDAYGGSFEQYLKHALMVPKHDPSPLAGAESLGRIVVVDVSRPGMSGRIGR